MKTNHSVSLRVLLLGTSLFGCGEPSLQEQLSPASVAADASVAASYYVSPGGSDSNAGTIDAPFQTIAKARDVVRGVNGNMAGDIYVYLRGGTHNVVSTLAFGPQDSGTNGYRIYYQAYPGETPILSGATRVTGWSQYSGNIYKSTLNRSTKLRNLYVNDQRAAMTSKTVTAAGGYGTYSVTAGQASWAWVSGSESDGVQYNTSNVPSIASNRDDLEIVNGTTWNENIACVRDVITSGSYRVLLLQQPYGAIAQTPGWGAGFSVSGTQTIYNAFEFLNSPGQFYFDKTTKTLYYYLRSGENMATADVEAPVAEQLINIAGTSTTNRVKNLTFQGITFANTDYNLVSVGGSRGKATVQGATAFIAFGDGNWHNSKYEIVDTLPGVITVNNADSIQFIGNVVKHSGNEGISFINDVVNSSIVGNTITDIAGSGITVGHPQHVYVGDGGTHAKFPAGVEGVATNTTISNNLLYDISSAPGFGGHAGITAFFVDTLKITYNHIQGTAYNGINLGWGWQNFLNSTTCKNNTVSFNRLINTLTRLHDSGAVYTLGPQPGTNINQNYVRGIPPATSGPTYGLHNDEGSAYITENDNVLDIDPGVKYTINCEDFGNKHDLTILRTYATVNKMGANPPNSQIDPPVAVPDNVWPVAQYNTCLNSGIQEAYRSIIPSSLLAVQDSVFPASAAVNAGTLVGIRSSGEPSNTVWFAPSGTTNFVEGPTMTRALGTATSIGAPSTAGTYKLFVMNSQGAKVGESAAQLRVSGSASCTTVPPAPSNLQAAAVSSSQINLSWSTVAAPANCSVTYSVFRNGTQVAGNLTGGSFSDTGLSASTTYQYFVRALDAAGASANSGTAGATTQPASPSPGGGAQIVGGQSNRCLDVPNASTTNGAQTQLLDCGTSTGQRWTYTASKQLTVYGNKCLDVYGQGTSNGTSVVIWDCNGGTNQQWNVNANGTITGVQSGLCLDAYGAGTANGTKIIIWSCSGGLNQQWSLRN